MMGGKKLGRKLNNNSNAASEISENISSKAKSVSSNSSKRCSCSKSIKPTGHLEYLALPNLHVVAGVLKDHFKTLDQTHVKRLQHLISQIKTKHDECLQKITTKIQDQKNKIEKDHEESNDGKTTDDVLEIFSNISMIKSKSDESWSASTPVSLLNTEKNKDKMIVKKCNNESQTSQTELLWKKPNHNMISYKSVNTSCINLVDVSTCFPELTHSKSSMKTKTENKISFESFGPTTMLTTHQEPIMIPSVRFIESGGDSFYSCSTELSNYSNKLIVIKICLSDASNDISLDCKLTNKKIEKSFPCRIGNRLNGIYRLFESYKQSFMELLTMTDFSFYFKYIYLCLWEIVQVFWSLCRPKLPSLNRLQVQKCVTSVEDKSTKVQEEDLLITQDSDSFSGPKLKKFLVKRNYGRKKEEIVEMFRVSNICSILG